MITTGVGFVDIETFVSCTQHSIRGEITEFAEFTFGIA